MFGNFLYFIIALLILSLYQPVSQPRLPLFETLAVFTGTVCLFAIYTRSIFNRLFRRAQGIHPRILDQAFSRLVNRQSILALVLFAFYVWASGSAHLSQIYPCF